MGNALGDRHGHRGEHVDDMAYLVDGLATVKVGE